MTVAEKAKRVQRRYAGDADRPLGGYVAAMGAYSALVGGLTLLGRAVGARLPERFGAGDTVLLGAAMFKAGRLLAKDAVTSPLRAPFTRFEEPAGDVGRVGEPFEQVSLPPEIARVGGAACLAEEALHGVQAAVEGHVYQGESPSTAPSTRSTTRTASRFCATSCSWPSTLSTRWCRSTRRAWTRCPSGSRREIGRAHV